MMKIINFKKFIRITIVLIYIISLILIILSNTTYSKCNVSYKTEYVVHGETLWSIAQREGKYNKYYENKDVRKIVYDLKRINNFSNSNLKEGQEIKIPKL